jgi:very-short-patch-repair endonuclease
MVVTAPPWSHVPDVGGMAGATSDRHVRRSAARRLARQRHVEHLAEQQSGVVSRPQVYAAGVTRWEVRANLIARRWRAFGRQSIVTYNGPLTDQSREWAAVFEAGPRGFLDGASSLKAGGLKKFDVDRIRVSIPRGARVRRARGIDIRQTRRWSADDLAPGTGVPRSRNEVAAVRAALWARSDKQAALILTMTVQQGLAAPEQLGQQMLRVRRDRRRVFLNAVVLDLLGGVRSLGELEVARECRRRGLPEPSRQVLRKSKNGTYYLDLIWDDWAVVVEVDGIHHTWAQNVVSDALRQNDVTLQNASVLRMPLLGFRVAADDFFAQIKEALVAAGCPIIWAQPA